MTAEVGAAELSAGAAAALDVTADEVEIEAVAIDYAWGSPATAGLWRVDARSGDRRARCFAKALRHPRHWPGLAFIPAAWRDEFVSYFPWRFELDMHRAGVPDLLPVGMRAPRLHHVLAVDDDHLLLTWEFVDERRGPWRDDEYLRAAGLLGRFAARRREGAAVNEALPPACHDRSALRYLVERRLLVGTVPALRGGAMWTHPVVASALGRTGDRDLPERMIRLADRILDVLAMTERLPQTFAHGDASPQNLLVDEDGSFVVIDWGFGTLLPLGFDLGQLVVGLMHAGVVAPDELDRLAALVVPPYVAGCHAEELAVEEGDVWAGFVGGLACRSALLALPLERLGEPPSPELVDEFTDRIRLTARMLDLIDRRLPDPAG